MRLIASVCTLASLVACTEMTDFYPNSKTVEIEGRTFFVTPRPANGPGVYLAGPNDPTGSEVFLASNMTLPVANVAAIEAVTGCRVQRETIINLQVGTTYAAVKC